MVSSDDAAERVPDVYMRGCAGSVDDRDTNAAVNVMQRAYGLSVGWDYPYRSYEREPYLYLPTGKI